MFTYLLMQCDKPTSCLMTQQNVTFGVLGPGGGDYDPQIRTQVKLLYSAPSHQVLSFYVESFRSYRADKKPINKQTIGHH